MKNLVIWPLRILHFLNWRGERLKRYLSYLVLFLLLFIFLSTSVKGENYNGIKVLFDFTKNEDAGNADWRIDGAYSDFADALRGEGFIVDSLGDGDGIITSSTLENYDVFILPEPQNDFTLDERDAIVNFVENGGGLVYIADHKGSDRDNDGWDSWSLWNDNLNFDEIFEITLESTQSGNGENEITDIEDVPILTDNVTSFGSWLGTTMSVHGSAEAAAYQTISGTRRPVLAYTFYGSGRVVVFCDSSTFDDGTPDDDNSGDKLTNNWDDYDDSTLGVNLVKWASHQSIPELNFYLPLLVPIIIGIFLIRIYR
jgi:hypothetical protein